MLTYESASWFQGTNANQLKVNEWYIGQRDVGYRLYGGLFDEPDVIRVSQGIIFGIGEQDVSEANAIHLADGHFILQVFAMLIKSRDFNLETLVTDVEWKNGAASEFSVVWSGWPFCEHPGFHSPAETKTPQLIYRQINDGELSNINLSTSLTISNSVWGWLWACIWRLIPWDYR